MIYSFFSLTDDRIYRSSATAHQKRHTTVSGNWKFSQNSPAILQFFYNNRIFLVMIAPVFYIFALRNIELSNYNIWREIRLACPEN
jgi:hypothetical protein